MALDDYKALGFYEENLGNIQDGFGRFENGGEYYFTFNVGNQVYLISEGYSSENARENGINSVTTNMPNPDRYKYDVDGDGNHFFALRAGNNQEIATSRWFTSAGGAQEGASRLRGGGGTTTTTAFSGENMVAAGGAASINIAAPVPPAGPPKEKKKRKKRTTPKKPKAEKVYLQDGSYPINNVTYKIFRSGNGKHYFTFHREDGKTIFLNADVRGFETEDQAKTTVDQVFKYAPVEGNYEGKQTRNGKYYFYLKGNEGKNIAKSFFYGTPEDMQKAVGLMLGATVAGAAPAAAMAAVDDGAAERAAAEKAAAEKAAAEKAAAEKAAAEKASNVDEYLSCQAYQGHGKAPGHDDFSIFTEGGEFYFAMLDGGGKVRLRSEGYTSEKGRDNGIESVIKNRSLEERWSTLEEGGKHFGILKAGNHQEIGRSCPYNSAADAGWKWAAPVAAAAAVTTAKTANVDDYLACKEYTGHPKSPKHSDFTIFKKDGEHYFAMLDNSGKVRLRSEGYTTEKARDNGIESVVKNRSIEARWSTEEKMRKHFAILKAGNHQEIGRSCPYDSASGAAWKWAAPIAAVAAAAPVAKLVKKEKVVAAAAPVKKVVKKEEKKAPVTAVAAADNGGCMKWLWWILPLLLLLAVLWFVFKGCDGCNKATAVVAPIEEVVEEVVEETTKVIAVDTLEEQRLAAEKLAAEKEATRVAAEKAERERALEAQRRRGGNKNSGY